MLHRRWRDFHHYHFLSSCVCEPYIHYPYVQCAQLTQQSWCWARQIDGMAQQQQPEHRERAIATVRAFILLVNGDSISDFSVVFRALCVRRCVCVCFCVAVCAWEWICGVYQQPATRSTLDRLTEMKYISTMSDGSCFLLSISSLLFLATTTIHITYTCSARDSDCGMWDYPYCIFFSVIFCCRFYFPSSSLIECVHISFFPVVVAVACLCFTVHSFYSFFDRSVSFFPLLLLLSAGK